MLRLSNALDLVFFSICDANACGVQRLLVICTWVPVASGSLLLVLNIVLSLVRITLRSYSTTS